MEKIKLLFIGSESDSAMASFASSIINCVASDSERFEVHSVLLNLDSSQRSYNDKIVEKSKVSFIDYPLGRLARLIYKFWPNKLIKEIKQQVEFFSPDFVLFMTGDYSLSLFGLLCFDKRYTYFVHDLHPHTYNFRGFGERLFRNWVNRGYSWLTNKCLNLLTCSKSQYGELLELFPTKQIGFVNFPTLVTSKSISGNISVPELQNIDRYILFFGLVSHYKGVDLLIDAYKMSSLYGKCKLVIAGKGDNYSSDPHIIRINRFILDEEINDLFFGSELVVYPYRSATMSGVLSFPFYCRKKVLLSDIPFFKDYESKNVYYYQNLNLDDLVVQLNYAYNISYDMTIDNYEHFYSNNKMIDQIYNYFSSIISC